MESIPYVDTLVKEYLLFRGFTKSLSAFEADRTADRGCGFQAEQIGNLLFGRLVTQHDSDGLVALLESINTLFVSRIRGELEASAPKLETSVLRLYIVHAIESGKPEHVRQFFTEHGERLSRGAQAEEWSKWFALPFLQKPQAHPDFQVYFTKPWRQLVEASYRNFLAKAIAELPLPAILKFSTDRKQRLALQREVEDLQKQVNGLKGIAQAQQPSRTASGDLNASSNPAVKTATRPAAKAAPGATMQPVERPRSVTDPERALPRGAEAALAHKAEAGQQPAPSEDQQASREGDPTESTPLATSYETSALLSDTSEGEVDGILEEPTPRTDWREAEEPRDSGTGLLTTTGMSGASAMSFTRPDSPGQATDISSMAGQQESLQGHEAAVTDIIFAPDGRNVASASADGVVRVWAAGMLDSNQERTAVLLCGSPVRRLAWDTRADKIMLMGTAGKGVKAWHLDTKRMVAHMRPDPAFPTIADLACSPTEPSFLCATDAGNGRGNEGRLSIWNLRAFRKMQTFSGETRLCSVCYSSDGRTVTATGADRKLHLFDTSTASTTMSLGLGCKEDGPSFVRFLEARTRSLLTLSPDGKLRAWDIAMSRGPTWTMDISTACASGGAHFHRFAASSGGSSEAALTSASGQSHIVSGILRPDAKLASLALHQSAVPAVAWHPSERIVATGSADRTLLLTRLLPALA